MQNNLFFLCGPHGSGKTTLAEKIKEVNPRVFIPELYSRNIKFDIEPMQRLLMKICSRSIENFEYLQIARSNPDRIILGNRCIYDQQIYDKVYYNRGWISEDDFYLSNLLALNFYIPELRKPNAIVLNPGFDVVMAHLEKRWINKGKKWREEDLEYTKEACREYENLREKEGIYYIDHEVDLKSGQEIIESSEWLMKMCDKEVLMV